MIHYFAQFLHNEFLEKKNFVVFGICQNFAKRNFAESPRGEGDIFAEGRLTVAIIPLSPQKIQGFFIGKLTEQVAYAVFLLLLIFSHLVFKTFC